MPAKPPLHLLSALLEASRTFGMRRVIAADATHAELTYRSLWVKAFALRGALPLGERRYVGVLLPTSLPALVVFVALHLAGRVPAMLNFSAGSRNLLAACAMAEVDTVITARAFIEKGKLEDVAAALSAQCNMIYLEDLRPCIGLRQKLLALCRSLAPQRHFPAMAADDPAVILFTSGSEGLPKGVALSHSNILSNIRQAEARFSFSATDIMFNPLPVFHSFGLTAGLLLPLLLGIRVVLYPTPLHYHVIPGLCRKNRATIFLGTDTFLGGYARAAHDDDFRSVWLMVAGAEKLRDSTRQLYHDRFGVEIMQGYGVTEASPVIACNTPQDNKPGTVGRALPGIECRLEKVEGISHGGRLLVRGPNIMLGYLINPVGSASDSTGLVDGWYDTGDIVDIDAEGFIRILGRAKRFAKVGGEMVSLAAVEECAAALWPEHTHAALAAPDPRKGEHVVLLTECADATREAFLRHAQVHGFSELMVPKNVRFVEQLPRLGSGKVDYLSLKEPPPALAG